MVVFLIACFYTLYILRELYRGESRTPKSMGFFESAGGRNVRRREEPVSFWLSWLLRALGIPCAWCAWYMLCLLAKVR
ncbi:MAG: hypothetical protein KDA78_05260 [Planctomycetaceae bacterium]|nr:hypothetical protein [Planctomycetaceae bacterium]